MYLLALVPLIVFGWYKNGLHLYSRGLINFYEMLRPLIILLSSILGSFLGGLLREWKKGGKLDRQVLNKLKGDIVEATLVGAMLSVDSNFLVVFAVTFIFSLSFSKVNVNKVALIYLVIFGINALLGLNTFQNVYQANTALNYDGYDLFFGSGAGGIFSTNAFLILLAMGFLSSNKLYKKETVFTASLVFIILSVITNVISNNYLGILPYIFGYNFLFVFVFVAPNLYSSSYTTKGQIVSGILIAVLTFALSFVIPYASATIAVLVISALKGVLDRIFVIK